MYIIKGLSFVYHLPQPCMYILGHGVDGITGSHLFGKGQFLVVDIGSHDGSATLDRTHHSAHANHTAANDQHHVNIGDLGSADSMEANTHRLDKRTCAGSEQTSGNHLLPRQGDILTHGSPTLDTQCLVVLAGIHTAITA